MHRSRAQRVRDFRLVGLMLQQCGCIFQGALDTHEMDELPLPPHLITEPKGEVKWVKIKASLLRDSYGHFKIMVKEDQGGFYLDSVFPTDVTDDRERLQPRDYVVSLGRKPVDDMSLSAVRDLIKHAGSMLEIEVRRYAPSQAEERRKREMEEERQREESQLRRYKEQVADYVQKKPVSAASPGIGVGAGGGARGVGGVELGSGGASRTQCCLSSLSSFAPAPSSSATSDLLGESPPTPTTSPHLPHPHPYRPTPRTSQPFDPRAVQRHPPPYTHATHPPPTYPATQLPCA